MAIHPYAKTSLITACFFWLPALNFITNTLAIVFGVLALKEVKTYKEKIFAITGITVGIVTIVVSIIFIGIGVFNPELYQAFNATG